MDNTIPQSDVVSVVIDSSKTSTSDVETLEDVVIRQAELDSISAA